METYKWLTVGLWFLTAFISVLFFLEPGIAWIKKYNAEQAEKLSRHFREPDGSKKPAKIVGVLKWIEIGALAFGTIISFNPIIGLWAVGFALFGINYFAKLLDLREAEKFDDQMVDIAYAFKNSLRAGMSLQQAMQLVVGEFPPPASDEFEKALREIQLGASIEESLHHLEERLPNKDLSIMVNSIEILRQSGGNMVETFENLAETLKQRKKVEGKIRALTAQGRIQAIILCIMPFAMALILYFLNREYIGPLFSTLLGWVILSLVLALVSTGWLLIKKLITIEV